MKKFLIIIFIIYSCKTPDVSEMNSIIIFDKAQKYFEVLLYDKAISYYKAFINTYPKEKYPNEYLEAKYNIGLIRLKQLKKNKAKKVFQDVIKETAELSAEDTFSTLAKLKLEKI